MKDEDAISSTQHGSGVGRRTILKSIAVGAAVPFGINSVQAHTTSKSGENVVTLQRDFDNPIQKGDIITALSKSDNEHSSIRETNPSSLKVVSTPEIPHGSIVGAALKVDPTGTVHQSITVATRPRDVERAHQEVTMTAQKMRSKSPVQNDISAESNSNWTTKNNSKITTYNDPLGDFVTDYKFYYHNTKPLYSYKERYEGTSGILAYDSNNIINGGSSKHSWSQNGATTELADYGPRGTYSGSQSFGITLNGGNTGVNASLSYQYSQPAVSIVNQSIDRENYAKWKMNVSLTSPARKNTVTFDPGSMAKYESAQNGSHLLSVYDKLDVTGATLRNNNHFRQSCLRC